MIVTDTRGKRYRLWFAYVTLPAEIDRAQRRAAFASITLVSDEQHRDQASGLLMQRVRFGGLAFCSPSDPVVKVIGREIALHRALDTFADVTSWEDAQAIWQCYENRPRGNGQRVQHFTGEISAEGRADIAVAMAPKRDVTNDYTF